jgi:hypothetical protein
MAEAFGAQPQAPINQVSADWQATKAAYAFFNNPRAQSSDILLPHQQRTLEHMAAYPLVLAVQESSPSFWPGSKLGYAKSGTLRLSP